MWRSRGLGITFLFVVACSDTGGQATASSSSEASVSESESIGTGSSSDAGSSTNTDSAGNIVDDACVEAFSGKLITFHGVAEKGPVTANAVITIAALDGRGQPTGHTVEGVISNDLGEFTVPDVPEGPVAVSVWGTYYDELDDSIAAEPVTLRALGRAAADTAFNVNVLTHVTEIRARDLFLGGLCLDEALAVAEEDVVDYLRISSDVKLTRPAAQSSIAGADDLDNAYLLTLSVIALLAAQVGPGLQPTLDALAADYAVDDPGWATWPEGTQEAVIKLPADLILARLDLYLQAQGRPPGVPNMNRVLDQDGDRTPNSDDNCPFVHNFWQADGDNDGIGDICDCGKDACDCGFQAPDGDGDLYPDACDNCPEDANGWPAQDNSGGTILGDIDEDGIGNVCDPCPYTPGKGTNGNCCGPGPGPLGFGPCLKDHPNSTLWRMCSPSGSGITFKCVLVQPCSSNFGYGMQSCVGFPTAPPGALTPVCDWNESICDCDNKACSSAWCTVGDDAFCKAGNVCLPWHQPGEAPMGLEGLGACARVDQGPCVGKVGRECLMW